MPDLICNNDQCSQAFHHACLFEVGSEAYFVIILCLCSHLLVVKKCSNKSAEF